MVGPGGQRKNTHTPDYLERSSHFHRFYVVLNSMHIDLEVWFLTAKKVFLSNFEVSHTPVNEHILPCTHSKMCSFAWVWDDWNYNSKNFETKQDWNLPFQMLEKLHLPDQKNWANLSLKYKEVEFKILHLQKK